MFRRYGADDAQIVERVLKGDQDAFSALVTAYSSVVYSVALARLHNYADAEDLSQDAFLQAYRSLTTLHTPTRFGPWLVTLTKNLCYNALVQRNREERMSQKTISHATSVTAHPEQEEIHTILMRELETLDEMSREVLMLHYFTRKPLREIATLLDISKAAAGKRLQRARQALGERLLEVAGDALVKEDKSQERARRIMAAIQAVPLSTVSHLIPSTTTGNMTAAKAGRLFATQKLILGIVSGLCIMAGLYWSLQTYQTSTNNTVVKPVSTSQPVEKHTPEHNTSSTTLTQASEITKPVETRPVSAREPGEIADPSKYVTLSGRTLTRQGEPVVGTEITLVCYGISEKESKDNEYEHLKRAMNRSHQFKAVSNSQGQYVIHNIRFSGHAEINGMAQKGTWSGCGNTIELQEGVHHENVNILMDKEFQVNILRGRILSPTGSPVDDAVLIQKNRLGEITQSDAHGNFEIAYTNDPLDVYSAQYGITTFTDIKNVKDSFVELRMAGMATLSGQVTRSDGTPAAGIKVQLRGIIKANSGLYRISVAYGNSYSAITDLKGQYEIPEINAGLSMNVTVEETDASIQTNESLGYLPPNQVTKWDYVISKPIVVKGTIRGALTHQPLSDSTSLSVHVDQARRNSTRVNVFNSTYRITLKGGTKRYFIVPTYNQYYDRHNDFESYGREVDLTEGTEQIVDLEFPESATVPIHVIDINGNPIKEALVYQSNITPHGNDRCVTDETGHGSYPRLFLNQTKNIEGGALEIFHFEYFTEQTRQITGSPGQILPEETIVLYPPVEATGRLISVEGNSMANAEFEIRICMKVKIAGEEYPLGHVTSIHTDSMGNFRLKIRAPLFDLVGSMKEPNLPLSFSRSGIQCPAGLQYSTGQTFDLGNIQLENVDRSDIVNKSDG